MGSSPRAKLAWGIDFGDPNNTDEGYELEVDTYDFESEVMPGLFGFTEEAPERPPSGCTAGERKAWWDNVRDPYTPPTAEEVAAFGIVLDRLAYDGLREVKLLLAASYG